MPGPNDSDNALLTGLPLPTLPASLLLPVTPLPVLVGPDTSQKLNAQETTLPASATSSVATVRPTAKLFDATVLETLKSLPVTPGLKSPLGPYDLGGGFELNFDEQTLAGRISPALARDLTRSSDYLNDGGEYVFTGADCRIMIDCDYKDAQGATRNVRKQLIEATTLSISIHRVKTPARAFGYINPKGVARGTRTCGGTLILTQGTLEVLYRFLGALQDDLSKDTVYHKIDQLPPFNLTLFFSDETGHASFQRVLGVEFSTDGVIRSINDMMVEQTITWIAADVTPLMPLNSSSLLNLDAKQVKAEKSVADAMRMKSERQKNAIKLVGPSAMKDSVKQRVISTLTKEVPTQTVEVSNQIPEVIEAS